MRTWFTHHLNKPKKQQYVIWFLSLIGGLSLTATLQAQTLTHRHQQDVLRFIQSHQPLVVAQNKRLTYKNFAQRLASKRAVFVGETHDRYGHHLNQLAVLKTMYQQNPNLGIGVEWFQQQTQPVLDAYLAGRISETSMLKQTQYYDRWRYDYRLIRPVLAFAKANRIPVIALNAPSELTRKVARGGLEALTPRERQQLPAKIHPPSAAYMKRLQRVFAHHAHGKSHFENFALVQRIWDETMAMNTYRFLANNPKHRMIVFAGSGHVSNQTGIPNDLSRKLDRKGIATVLTRNLRDIKPKQADYFLVNKKPYQLATGARLGVWLQSAPDGLIISKVKKDSQAEKFGLKAGDRITFINRQRIMNIADLRIQLLSFKPKDRIQLTIERLQKNNPVVKVIPINFILQ